jgi:hypothetical protein
LYLSEVLLNINNYEQLTQKQTESWVLGSPQRSREGDAPSLAEVEGEGGRERPAVPWLP